MDIDEFVMARIDEKEEWLEHPLFSEVVREKGTQECWVDREIVTELVRVIRTTEPSPFAASSRLTSMWVLRKFAERDRKHPDYDPRWETQ